MGGDARVRQILTVLVFLPLILGGSAAAQAPTTLRGVGATYIEPHGGYSLDTALQAVGAQWWYGWRRMPGGDGVPMIWGRGDLGKPINGDAEWVMFYNEPEHPDQANVTPQQAATDWITLLSLYPNRRYTSPGCYSVEWLQDWLSRIVEKPDALAAHCYMTRDGAVETGCQDHIRRFIALAEQHNIPEVWVTEFAYVPQPGEGYDAAIAWMEDITAWMDSQPMITRYAWFQLAYLGSEPWAWGADRNTSLVDYGTGELTVLGHAYRGEIPEPVPSPAYADPRADVTSDGVVNILDLSLVGANFGRVVP